MTNPAATLTCFSEMPPRTAIATQKQAVPAVHDSFP